MGTTQTKRVSRDVAEKKIFDWVLNGLQHNMRVTWSMYAVAIFFLNPFLIWLAWWVGVDKNDPTYADIWKKPTYSGLISPYPFNSWFNFWIGVALTCFIHGIVGDLHFLLPRNWKDRITLFFFVVLVVAIAAFARCPVTEMEVCHDITLAVFFLSALVLVLWSAMIRKDMYLVVSALWIVVFSGLFVATTLAEWQDDPSQTIRNLRGAFEMLAILGLLIWILLLIFRMPTDFATTSREEYQQQLPQMILLRTLAELPRPAHEIQIQIQH